VRVSLGAVEQDVFLIRRWHRFPNPEGKNLYFTPFLAIYCQPYNYWSSDFKKQKNTITIVFYHLEFDINR
jgi:hypothetical protein